MCVWVCTLISSGIPFRSDFYCCDCGSGGVWVWPDCCSGSGSGRVHAVVQETSPW